MVAIRVRFTTGRYYARAWDNSGAEWPPSPYRILRAMIAAWKYNLSVIPEEDVQSVVRMLSSERPFFVLPPAHAAVENDSQKNTTAPYVSVNSRRYAYILWPNVRPNLQQRAILKKILSQIHYLGRTKSWCAMDLAGGTLREPNCIPLNTETDHRCVTYVLLPASDITLNDLYTASYGARKTEAMRPDGSRYVGYRIKMNDDDRSRCAGKNDGSKDPDIEMDAVRRF